MALGPVPQEEQNPVDREIATVPDKWPTPGWYTGKAEPGNSQTYKSYLTRDLRRRYMELEGDYRTEAVHGPDHVPTQERIEAFLCSARVALEGQEPDLLTVSNTLGLAEQYMISLFPEWLYRSKTARVLASLKSLHPEGWKTFVDEIDKFYRTTNELAGKTKSEFLGWLDEAVGLLNRHFTDSQISNGLQIERLKILRTWGYILLAVFLVASPLAIKLDSLKDLPASTFVGQAVIISWRPVIISWLAALAIVITGALGGFLSGLLEARSSRITLIDYQENILKLQLKLLIGGIVALILFILLSWGIISGVTITNPGTYFLVAFLSGFSERYFLRLLNADGNGGAERPPEAQRPATEEKG